MPVERLAWVMHHRARIDPALHEHPLVLGLEVLAYDPDDTDRREKARGNRKVRRGAT
jgi:hypothetical protein